MANEQLRQVLPVPYHAQVSEVHCQSTVLKMYAQYLDRFKFPGVNAGAADAQQIWNDINLPGHPDKRADKVLRNSHKNIKQWLEDRYFLTLQWSYLKDAATAFELIVKSVNSGFPVIAGVSHARVVGHIVLIIGYEMDGLTFRLSAPKITQSFVTDNSHKLVVHDPYGAFHPSLGSDLHSKKRFDGGMSLRDDAETGPGKGVVLSLFDVSRQRGLKIKGAHGDFNLMTPV